MASNISQALPSRQIGEYVFRYIAGNFDLVKLYCFCNIRKSQQHHYDRHVKLWVCIFIYSCVAAHVKSEHSNEITGCS